MLTIARRQPVSVTVLSLLALLQDGAYPLGESSIAAGRLERLLGFSGSQSSGFDVQPLRQILAHELANFSVKYWRILGRFLRHLPNTLQPLVDPSLAHAPTNRSLNDFIAMNGVP